MQANTHLAGMRITEQACTTRQGNTHKDAHTKHNLSLHNFQPSHLSGLPTSAAYLMLMLRSAELLPVATFCAAHMSPRSECCLEVRTSRHMTGVTR